MRVFNAHAASLKAEEREQRGQGDRTHKQGDLELDQRKATLTFPDSGKGVHLSILSAYQKSEATLTEPAPLSQETVTVTRESLLKPL